MKWKRQFTKVKFVIFPTPTENDLLTLQSLRCHYNGLDCNHPILIERLGIDEGRYVCPMGHSKWFFRFPEIIMKLKKIPFKHQQAVCSQCGRQFEMYYKTSKKQSCNICRRNGKRTRTNEDKISQSEDGNAAEV